MALLGKLRADLVLAGELLDALVQTGDVAERGLGMLDVLLERLHDELDLLAGVTMNILEHTGEDVSESRGQLGGERRHDRLNRRSGISVHFLSSVAVRVAGFIGL